VDAIEARLDDVRIGPGIDPESEMGPLVTREHREAVAAYLDVAADEGAKVRRDGREQSFEGDGFFLGLSLVDDVQPWSRLHREEIFGPVLAVIRVPTYDEAVGLINDHELGNGCAIYTRDGGAARRFQFDVQCGMVGVNVPIPVPVSFYSFGGWKASLFGDSHMYGPEGVHFYTRTKVVTQRWPDPSTSSIDLGFPQNR
jgi:malonate-semialdehyde dehydrogenase (acetylating)/methylmalonate-semialdehyde dehydrogenase